MVRGRDRECLGQWVGLSSGGGGGGAWDCQIKFRIPSYIWISESLVLGLPSAHRRRE